MCVVRSSFTVVPKNVDEEDGSTGTRTRALLHVGTETAAIQHSSRNEVHDMMNRDVCVFKSVTRLLSVPNFAPPFSFPYKYNFTVCHTTGVQVSRCTMLRMNRSGAAKRILYSTVSLLKPCLDSHVRRHQNLVLFLSAR